MTKLTEEDREAVEYKLDKIKRSLDMYKSYENQIKLLNYSSLKVKDTLDKISKLRLARAREVALTIKKYGWLDPNDISLDAYNAIIEAIIVGSIDVKKSLLPKIKAAYQEGKINDDDYNRIIDSIITNEEFQTVQNNSKSKTFK